ncbi:dTDP-4-dehydrorhamnose 3,5-epimerase [Sunxiuqinia rutila]|uniref:dTDP-4-dehydrorhamnose 3,5-epimerase n=1 Tax=Sunxiuqinia rutila TaxID=1397841 RepID=UPI003D36CC56
MKITERKLKGVYEIQLQPHLDPRGFFMRIFDEKILEEAGLGRHWVQENHSRSERAGIIRGLHIQMPPYSETKMLRCIHGSIIDYFVDLRKGSPTYGQWDSIELSAENKKMIFIPRGFAHAFCTLSEISEVTYKVDNPYVPESERAIIWNDPTLNIEWPTDNPQLSDKDLRNMTFKEFDELTGGGVVI